MREIKFTVYAKAEPQGSAKGFVVNGRAIVTGDNKKTRPYRGEVTREALSALEKAVPGSMTFYVDKTEITPFALKHVPVRLAMHCYFRKPPSIPKRRTHMVVKPDLSKLLRSTEDAMIGIMYHDDSQIVAEHISKNYGSPERVEICVQVLED